MQQAGADVQGRKLNTALINSTIDRLNAHGGGTLFFPAGTYLTGSIHMKSNITLELEAGATLKFSENFDDFLPYVEVRHEGIMMKSFQPLIYAVDAENITIKGEGTLDGQGKAWWTEFFRVLVDLRDNGKRNINKYQPMFEKENDLKALYAETNEDWHGTLDRRFFRPPFIWGSQSASSPRAGRAAAAWSGNWRAAPGRCRRAAAARGSWSAGRGLPAHFPYCGWHRPRDRAGSAHQAFPRPAQASDRARGNRTSPASDAPRPTGPSGRRRRNA